MMLSPSRDDSSYLPADGKEDHLSLIRAYVFTIFSPPHPRRLEAALRLWQRWQIDFTSPPVVNSRLGKLC